MRLYLLEKQVFKLTGNAAKFLNGLTSNTMDAQQNAFLNMHGRIIATFEQIRITDEEFIIVVANSAVVALKSHIERYLKLNHTTLSETALKCYFDVDGDAPVNQGDMSIAQPHGKLLITATDYPNSLSEEEFTLFRLNHNIPLHGKDYQDEMLLNVHEYAFASYTKGCFLGQEMVAKVHNRSKPTWALKVRFEDEFSADDRTKMTSVILDPAQNRRKGFIFVANT